MRRAASKPTAERQLLLQTGKLIPETFDPRAIPFEPLLLRRHFSPRGGLRVAPCILFHRGPRDPT